MSCLNQEEVESKTEKSGSGYISNPEKGKIPQVESHLSIAFNQSKVVQLRRVLIPSDIKL